MSNDLIPDPAANAALEHRRDIVRTRLFHAVEALDAKRKQIVEVGHRGKEIATIAVLAGGAALVLAAAPILVYRGYRHFRGPSLNVRLARWIEPFREPRKPSFFVEVVEKVTLAAVAMLAREIARGSMRKALEAHDPDGRRPK